MTATELALTESPSLRAQYATRTDVLDRVKALALLPDGVHATTELVASYYEVDAKTIEKLAERNRAELESNGYRVLTGTQLTDMKSVSGVATRARSLAVYDRRAILNVGQLLRDSDVARRVRTYLLDVEGIAPAGLRSEAIERAAISRTQMEVLRLADGLVDRAWLEAKTRHTVARALGEEPEVNFLDRPLSTGEFLQDKGITGADLRSIAGTFGKRVKPLYVARYGHEPAKVERFVDGALRQVNGYTERDRDLMEQAWASLLGGRVAS